MFNKMLEDITVHHYLIKKKTNCGHIYVHKKFSIW